MALDVRYIHIMSRGTNILVFLACKNVYTYKMYLIHCSNRDRKGKIKGHKGKGVQREVREGGREGEGERGGGGKGVGKRKIALLAMNIRTKMIETERERRRV